MSDIAPPPGGPNPITNNRNEIVDDQEVVFIAGEINPNYPLVSNLFVAEKEQGSRVTMDARQALELERFYRGRISGYHLSLVMMCANRCPYQAQCPIISVGLNPPTGEPCPWESGLFKARVVALCAELGVEPTNNDQYVDYNTIRDIAATEMLLERVSMEVALMPQTIVKQAVGVDGDGNAIYQDMVNKRYEWLNQLNKKKVTLLESLSATRKERIKAGVATGQDPASYVTDLMRTKVRMIDLKAGDVKVTTKTKPELPEPDDDGMIAFELEEDELTEE